ncbi:hypothetical protein CXB51_009585 [Gossypium anomalum]|uniref:DUF7745 domain-containing protein n=1 Tax=Gossypium anomalum TaxID=47600 RepID=A0A8J5ZC59_9ROSI|nr:hypothetical protein CXB51_009585 [Gossypium anomalum]
MVSTAWRLRWGLRDGSKKLRLSEVFTSAWASGLLLGYIRTDDFDFTRVNVAQNELQLLKDIWASWDDGIKQLFYQSYGDISYLLDKHLFRVIVPFWNSTYKCFTFGDVDLVPTMEEYTTLLRCPKIQVRKTYALVFNSQIFVKKLMSISEISEPWVTARMQQKGDSKCIPWENLRDLTLTHPDERKRVDIFALSIYGLIIFPKALRHMDEAVIDLFDRLEKGITPVPAILAETFRSLSSCRKTGEGRFIGCTQLLMAAIQRREDISEEKWMEILQNLKEGDIEWRAYWMVPDEIMYRCGNFDWVPLLGIWGATGYTPLLALRQYKSRQFVPMTYGLAQSEFSFKGAHYKKKVRELSDARKQTCWMKRLAVHSMVTPEYEGWFKKRSSKLRKKIEQLEKEKMHLRLDADVQRSEAEKWRKGKTKAEEDLDSLKTDYKKLRLSMRTAGLEKSLSKSRNERGKLRARVAELEKSLHQYRNLNIAMELRASLSKIEEMKGRIEELEASLQNCEIRIQFFEVNEDHWKEQLHHAQDQVRNRDYLMGEAISQIREVTDYLQALAVQANTLSIKYELESDRGQELASNLETNENQPTTHPYGTRKKSMDKKLEKFEQIQKDMQEQIQSQMQEQLAKIQREMKEQMMETQREMMSQLSQLLLGGTDKGKRPMDKVEETNEDPQYPLALLRHMYR